MQKAEAHVYFLNTIGMGDWFWGTTLNDVRYCVEGWAAYDGGSLPDSELPATVILHFPACRGGDVVEGYGIYNYLRSLAARGVKVEARVEGLCASIAVLCALAADAVLMADAALWMVHKPSSSGCGNADELRAEADILDKIQAQIVSRYVARCGGKLDAVTANDLINKESWLNADECLAYGFVTGKLHEEPLVAPTGADAVLNYFPTKKPDTNMAKLNAVEEKGLFARFKAWLNEDGTGQPTTPPEPVATNAATSIDVQDGDPMYFDGTDLAQGTAVYSDDAMTIAYADGDYTLGDGRAASVASGVISSLADAAAEDNAPENSADVAAENAALKEQLAAAQAENALNLRKLTAAQNKLNKVPGSAGNPTPPGAAQNLTKKPGAANNATTSPFKITHT